MSDESINQGNKGTESQGAALTPQEAQAKISLIRADKTHFYNTPSSWDNKANQRAKDEVEGLYKIAYGTEESDGLGEMVKREFGSKADLESEADSIKKKMEAENFDRQVLRSETELRLQWGSQENFDEKIGYAYLIKDGYLKSPEDQKWLEGPAGNDVQLIMKLSDLGEHILRTYHKDEFQKGVFKNYMKTRKPRED